MPSKSNGATVRRQYGEWLKAGGVIKNRGDKDKLKMQLEAKKGSSPSMVVDGRAGEEIEVVRRRSPAVVVAGGADEVSGSAVMMDAAPLGMLEGSITSTHREMGRQIRWEDSILKASGKGLERTACEEQNGAKTDVDRNELHGNEVSSEVVEKRCGPAIKEAEILSPIGPKGKGGLSEERECGPVIREADVLSPLRLKEKESPCEE